MIANRIEDLCSRENQNSSQAGDLLVPVRYKVYQKLILNNPEYISKLYADNHRHCPNHHSKEIRMVIIMVTSIYNTIPLNCPR